MGTTNGQVYMPPTYSTELRANAFDGTFLFNQQPLTRQGRIDRLNLRANVLLYNRKEVEFQ